MIKSDKEKSQGSCVCKMAAAHSKNMVVKAVFCRGAVTSLGKTWQRQKTRNEEVGWGDSCGSILPCPSLYRLAPHF